MIWRVLGNSGTIAVAFAVGLSACGKANDVNEQATDKSPQVQTPNPPVEAPDYEAIGSGMMELRPVAGWGRTVSGGFTIFASPDGKARLLVGAFEASDEMNPALDQAAKALGAIEHRFAEVRSATLGKDRVPAKMNDGYARYASGDGAISYALIDGEGTKQTLIMYALERDVLEPIKSAGMKAIASLRRKHE